MCSAPRSWADGGMGARVARPSTQAVAPKPLDSARGHGPTGTPYRSMSGRMAVAAATSRLASISASMRSASVNVGTAALSL